MPNQNTQNNLLDEVKPHPGSSLEPAADTEQIEPSSEQPGDTEEQAPAENNEDSNQEGMMNML